MFKPFKQSGFLKLPNDNMVKTIAVAVLLCLVCSIIVSTAAVKLKPCLLYTSPSPRDLSTSRMPSSA